MDSLGQRISSQLEALNLSASSAAFEAQFAASVSSLGALQITLSHARDHLLRGLTAIDEATTILDRIPQPETTGDPE